MTDSTKAFLGSLAALLALVAIVQIMATCSIKVDQAQMQAADCAKRGGTWHASTDISYCDEPHK